jgi:hypothetical protein
LRQIFGFLPGRRSGTIPALTSGVRAIVTTTDPEQGNGATASPLLGDVVWVLVNSKRTPTVSNCQAAYIRTGELAPDGYTVDTRDAGKKKVDEKQHVLRAYFAISGLPGCRLLISRLKVRFLPRSPFFSIGWRRSLPLLPAIQSQNNHFAVCISHVRSKRRSILHGHANVTMAHQLLLNPKRSAH